MVTTKHFTLDDLLGLGQMAGNHELLEGELVVVTPEDTLTGGDLPPGFAVPVAEIFG